MNVHNDIVKLLGDKASWYLEHVCDKIEKDKLQEPGRNFIDEIFVNTNTIIIRTAIVFKIFRINFFILFFPFSRVMFIL